MKYAYEKVIAEEKLTLDELPEDAKIGIETIKKIERAIVMTEKKGHKVRPDVANKLKANDKWVTREILEYAETKGKGGEKKPEGTAEVPHTAEVVVAEIKADEVKDEVKVDEKGLAIDKELAPLFEAGTTAFSTAELKEKAPRTYSIIFDNYKDNEENGVETSYYKVIETEKEKFTLTKI